MHMRVYWTQSGQDSWFRSRRSRGTGCTRGLGRGMYKQWAREVTESGVRWRGLRVRGGMPGVEGATAGV